MTRTNWPAPVAGVCLALLCSTAVAQHHHPAPPAAADSTRRQQSPSIARPSPTQQPPSRRPHAVSEHAGHAGHDAGAHAMPAMYGGYAMSREASGTAWQPDGSPHEGLHATRGPWMVMAHGFATLVWNDQGGPRGGDEGMSTNMLMAMASRPWGVGRLGLRAMLSAEPATMGKDGYALLLQTGETADGVEELIDRQHPHDLFMELATSYAVTDATRSMFVYFGLPGEPAIGPPTFMHRSTGVEFPDSPISHHWLDSTHITFGVLTLGAVWRDFKLEGSAFTGREPDQDRYDIEEARFDSRSMRASWNPTPAWALQASHGWIESPEQLHPETDVDRTTASAMFAHTAGDKSWYATLAWGRNRNHPGRTLDAWLVEQRFMMGGRHTFIGRGEVVEKDELFHEPDPLADRLFRVGKLSAGYVLEAIRGEHMTLGLGATGSLIMIPDDLEAAYGERPTAALLFARLALR